VQITSIDKYRYRVLRSIWRLYSASRFAGGAATLKRGEYEDAIKPFDRAPKLDPKNAESQKNAAFLRINSAAR
jgi:Flp pilus assembly protein TadD